MSEENAFMHRGIQRRIATRDSWRAASRGDRPRFPGQALRGITGERYVDRPFDTAQREGYAEFAYVSHDAPLSDTRGTLRHSRGAGCIHPEPRPASAQPTKVGVFWCGGPQTDPGVDGVSAIRPRDHRAYLELGDLRQVVGNLRDPQQQVP